MDHILTVVADFLIPISFVIVFFYSRYRGSLLELELENILFRLKRDSLKKLSEDMIKQWMPLTGIYYKYSKSTIDDDNEEILDWKVKYRRYTKIVFLLLAIPVLMLFALGITSAVVNYLRIIK